MTHSLRFALTVLVVTVAGTELRAQTSTERALLVGCTKYDNLDPQYWLEGPANDAPLMRDVLKKYYGFHDEHIVILSEAAAKEHGKEFRPTRANIQREFAALARKCQAGDRVVILLGGHGSQEPDSRPDDPKRFKPDGKEEIFLPADCGKWDGATGRVQGAIVDYEFRDWLGAIRKTGAKVWVIFDACHSASLARAYDANIKLREVPAQMLVPRPVLRQAEDKALERVKKERPRDVAAAKKRERFKAIPDEPDLVAIYAAQTTEPTVEMILPEEGNPRKPQGLLTYTICKIIVESKAVGSRLTYQELLHAVHDYYQQARRSYPTPLIEGKDRNEPVLWERGVSRGGLMEPADDDALQAELKPDEEGNWYIEAGALHGLTIGSILKVYPPVTERNADQPVGCVKVIPEGFATLKARVEPCAYERMEAPRELPKNGRCKLVFINLESQRLAIAVDARTIKGEPVPEERRRAVQESVKKLEKEDQSLARYVDSPAQAKWILCFDSLASNNLYLMPAAGWVVPTRGQGSTQTGAVVQVPRQFGPIPEGSARLGWLRDSLTSIARVRNLLGIVSRAEALTKRSQNSALGVKARIELVRLASEDDPEGVPIQPDEHGITLRSGELVGIKFINDGRNPVDVNLFLIDAQYGISSVFPEKPGTNSRISPGGSIRLEKRLTGDVANVEQLLLIAVNAKDVADYAYFGFLAQPSLKAATEELRGVSGGARERGIDSPLGQVLQNGVFGTGKTRGMEPVKVAEYGFQTLTYNLLPSKGPAPRK